MTDVATLAPPAESTLVPTPNADSLPRRYADFATFAEALDYAAQGKRGLNFHDPRGTLIRPYPFRELRGDALEAAYRLIARGVKPGDRIALIAETGTDFAALFCGAIYAGAWPVPLPLPTSFGGKDSYIDQIAVQMKSAEPTMLLFPEELAEMAGAAAAQQGCEGLAWQQFNLEPAKWCKLPEAKPDDICFLQYSSGSTRFPHGVAVTHRALLANLAGHGHGMQMDMNDRCVSWLPWYHDMGLVGCFLSLIANQISGDYLKTEDFARRPLAWLDLISRNPGDTISFSPTFGYDICSRRVSSQTHVTERFDLSRWRLAGNGADMIRPDVMQNFVNVFADAGFSAKCIHAELRPRRIDVVRHADAAGRGHSCRTGRGRAPVGLPARSVAPGPLPRHRQLRQGDARHEGRSARREQQGARRSPHRQGLVQRHQPDAQLLPRSRSHRRLHAAMAGSIPATWAIWPKAICSSSGGRRT